MRSPLNCSILLFYSSAETYGLWVPQSPSYCYQINAKTHLNSPFEPVVRVEALKLFQILSKKVTCPCWMTLACCSKHVQWNKGLTGKSQLFMKPTALSTQCAFDLPMKRWMKYGLWLSWIKLKHSMTVRIGLVYQFWSLGWRSAVLLDFDTELNFRQIVILFYDTKREHHLWDWEQGSCAQYASTPSARLFPIVFRATSIQLFKRRTDDVYGHFYFLWGWTSCSNGDRWWFPTYVWRSHVW